jgi:aspartyl-tRNA(Asn)/glutamyl-tRNA(Gln) amidotransferase subunit A
MASIPDTVFFSSLGELSAKLKAREFSAVELAKAFLDRLEKLGPRLNALALPLRQEALRQARRVDRDLKKDRPKGVLQGIPYGVKDLLAVAGHPTTWGAAPYAGQVFDADAKVVQKLEKAGAICIGKLAMVELAGGGGYRFAAASLTGPALNPWDRSRWAGGSSSGSGAAVAAGLVPFALGSETSGSIVTPAAYCGVTGLRPTYGYVSRSGAMALSWTLDKIGPMARSAEDCGLILQAIAGKDSDDAGTAGKSFYYAPQFARSFKDLKIGYAPADFEAWAQPETQPAFRAALDAFKSFGCQMVEVEIPDFPYGPVLQTILGAEAGSIFEELIASGQVDKLADEKQIAGLKATQGILAKDYLKAMRIRRLIMNAFRELFFKVDVLLAPARNSVASKVQDPLDAVIVPKATPKSRGLQGLTPATNLVGAPALFLPCGFVDGLPLAVQLVGRAFSENTLLAFGRAYQAQTDWHRRQPKLPA